MFPPTSVDTERLLVAHGFTLDQSDYIVMQVTV